VVAVVAAAAVAVVVEMVVAGCAIGRRTLPAPWLCTRCSS
jgi:hypothetical protein